MVVIGILLLAVGLLLIASKGIAESGDTWNHGGRRTVWTRDRMQATLGASLTAFLGIVAIFAADGSTVALIATVTACAVGACSGALLPPSPDGEEPFKSASGGSVLTGAGGASLASEFDRHEWLVLVLMVPGLGLTSYLCANGIKGLLAARRRPSNA